MLAAAAVLFAHAVVTASQANLKPRRGKPSPAHPTMPLQTRYVIIPEQMHAERHLARVPVAIHEHMVVLHCDRTHGRIQFKYALLKLDNVVIVNASAFGENQ